MQEQPQKNYMVKVKNAMLFYFKNKEIQNTLEDISALFEAGIEHGRSADEIIRNMEAPKEFVSHMLDSDSVQKKPRISFWRFLAASLLLVLCIRLLYISSVPLVVDIKTNLELCAIAAFVPLFLWYLSGGSCIPSEKAPAALKKSFLACAAIVCLIALIEQFFIYCLYVTPRSPLFPWTQVITVFISVLLCIFILVCALQMQRGNLFFLLLCAMFAGLLGTSVYYLNFLNLFETNPTGIHLFRCICLFPYLCGTATSFLLAFRKGVFRHE